MYKTLTSILVLICFSLSLAGLAQEKEEKKDEQKKEETKKKKKSKKPKEKKEKPVIDLTPTSDELHLASKGELIIDEVLPLKDKAKFRNKGFVHGSMDIIEGGGVTGKTDPKYKGHAANFALNFDHENAIYEFEMKLEDHDSTGGIRVGYHMASASFTLKQLAMKSDVKPVDLAPGKWHKVTVIRMGRHVSLEIGGVKVKGEEPKLTPKIGAIRLSVKGVKNEDGKGFKLNAIASYRNLKVWKAVKIN